MLFIELLQIIFNISDLYEQLKLIQINKYLNEYLKITDFYNIDYTIRKNYQMIY